MEWDDEFAAFVRQHADALYRRSWLLVGDRDAAADLVQETLTRLYPKWPLVSGARSPVAYVRASLTRQYLSQARRRSSTEVAVAEVPDRPGLDPGRDLDDRIVLIPRLAALSARQRAAIVLRYFEDLDDREAARVMGCPVATFRSHVRRGLSALRDALGLDADEPSDPRQVRSTS